MKHLLVRIDGVTTTMTCISTPHKNSSYNRDSFKYLTEGNTEQHSFQEYLRPNTTIVTNGHRYEIL